VNKYLKSVGCGFAILPFLASNALAAYKPIFHSFQTWQEFWVRFLIAILLSGLVWWQVKIGRSAQVLVIFLIIHLLVTTHVPGAWYWAVQLLQLVVGVAVYFFL
jgi:hypothetical protein